MQLTISLIYTYINLAHEILKECYPKYSKPNIVEVRISKAQSYWAAIYNDELGYHITVSNTFNQITDESLFAERLISSMIHELIHTIPGCMNHGSQFKRIAYLVNIKYPQYNIQRSTRGSDYGINLIERPYKYKVICTKCGSISKYKRKPQIWSELNSDDCSFYCSNCGGSKFTGELLHE